MSIERSTSVLVIPNADPRKKPTEVTYDMTVIRLTDTCSATIRYPLGSTVGSRCNKEPHHHGEHVADVTVTIAWPNEAMQPTWRPHYDDEGGVSVLSQRPALSQTPNPQTGKRK